MMKALLLVLALLVGAASVPPQASASCLTGCALDNYARDWFQSYQTSAGYSQFHCGSAGSSNVRFQCAQGANAIYWQGRSMSSGCPSATTNSRDYQIWIHPTTWQWTFNVEQCFCFSGSTWCQWQ